MANVGQKQDEVAECYENLNGILEVIFGEHLHPGFYDPGATATISNSRAAAVRMIDETLRLANISDDPAAKPKNMVDVGCGIGGTCLHVARKYDIKCKGIDISPENAQRAQDRAAAQGLESKVSFDVGDALDMPYPDGTFDLVFAVNSMEHIEDKQKLIREMVRVAAPGAAIIFVSSVHRNHSPSEKPLKPQEKKVLKKICDSLVLSDLCSSSDYVKWLTALCIEDIKTADWTQNTVPFYSLLLKETISWKGFMSLLMNGGWSAFKIVLGLRMISKAANDGLVRCGAFSGRKPN